ncbi:MAG: acyl-CoA dehydrogenase family protein [Pseudomonadales bacterium]|nr:acyl-CoA dehydrogenase family protein [Pseudomonadales bacterium]
MSIATEPTAPLALSEEQGQLQRAAREFAAARFSTAQLRAYRDERDPLGYSRALWREMAELGWTGIPFPEQYGGLGLGLAELGVVLEELGRRLLPTPFLSTVLLTGRALLLGGSEAQKQALLPALCAGERVIALAFQEQGRFAPWQVATRAERSAAGYRLSGEKRFVLDGAGADHWLALARTAGRPGERDGLTLFLLDAGTPGIDCLPTPLIDARNAVQLTLREVAAGPHQVVGEVDGAAEILEPVFDGAAAGLAAELLGVLSEAFDRTLAYLRVRRQFGVPIGSFQALQHRAADLFCERELAISVTRAALRALDAKRPDAPALASAAKARVSDTANRVGRESIQMFGGIGMTDEEDIGLYMKRARAAETTLGDGAWHRDRFASINGY